MLCNSWTGRVPAIMSTTRFLSKILIKSAPSYEEQRTVIKSCIQVLHPLVRTNPGQGRRGVTEDVTIFRALISSLRQPLSETGPEGEAISYPFSAEISKASATFHALYCSLPQTMSNSFSDPTEVTISLLPASLSLVHIPRSRLNGSIFHPVIKQILHPNPTFLNITCNEIELSLFAEHEMLADFEPIARRDRARQRSRSGSGSMRRNPPPGYSEPVEISYERWNVLQIDSHSDQLGMFFFPDVEAALLL